MGLSTLVAIEWKKLLRCKPFWAVLTVGIVCAAMAAAGEVSSYLQNEPTRASTMEYAYHQPFAFSPYTRWIPVDRIEFWANLFVFIAPMLIALAYSWSLRSELLTGYAQNLYVTVTRPRYYLSKAIVTFIAGGLTVALPLIIDFGILACFLPLYTPSIIDVTAFGIYSQVPLSQLFYQAPWLFVIARLLIDFALAGLWATLVLGLSLFLRNRVVLMVGPYLILIALKYGSEQLYALIHFSGPSITLIDLLRSSGDAYNYTLESLAACTLLMLLASVVLPLVARKRDVL